MNVREELFKNQDLEYRDFNKKLIPNIDIDNFIGVRVPIIRDIAKEAASENVTFIPEYQEELMVFGLAIGYSKCSIDEYIKRLDEFVPMISSWAVCDTVCSNLKFTKNHLDKMWDYIIKYKNGSEYEVRFTVVMIMDYYLNDEYIDRALDVLSTINREEYYIKMAVAWALATALAKFEDKTLPIFENKSLDTWVHNKAIQKARESYRVPKEKKDYLNSLKIK